MALPTRLPSASLLQSRLIYGALDVDDDLASWWTCLDRTAVAGLRVT